MDTNPIDTFLKGQKIVNNAGIIDDSRELLIDELYTVIDGDLSSLLNTDSLELAKAVVKAACIFEQTVINFISNKGTDERVLQEGAKTMAVIVASYAQVLRIIDTYTESVEGE